MECKDCGKDVKNESEGLMFPIVAVCNSCVDLTNRKAHALLAGAVIESLRGEVS